MRMGAALLIITAAIFYVLLAVIAYADTIIFESAPSSQKTILQDQSPTPTNCAYILTTTGGVLQCD